MRGKVMGPFGLERLREFRDEGQLQPFHEVSQDQITWEPMARLDGLFQGRPVVAAVPPPNRIVAPPPPSLPVLTVSPEVPPLVPDQPRPDYSLSGWFSSPKNVGLLIGVCVVLALACWLIVDAVRARDRDREVAELRQDLEARTAEMANLANEVQRRDDKLRDKQKEFSAERDRLEETNRTQQVELEKLRKAMADPGKGGDENAKALEAAEQARKTAEEARAASEQNAQRKDKVLVALREGFKGADKLVSGIDRAGKGDVDVATLKEIVAGWLDSQAKQEAEARVLLAQIKDNMLILERGAMKKRTKEEDKAHQTRKEAVEKIAAGVLERTLSGAVKKEVELYLEQLKKL
jgi:hypothetical protein